MSRVTQDALKNKQLYRKDSQILKRFKKPKTEISPFKIDKTLNTKAHYINAIDTHKLETTHMSKSRKRMSAKRVSSTQQVLNMILLTSVHFATKLHFGLFR